MATFGAASFQVLVAGRGVSRTGRVAEVAIPGGDQTYLFLGGKGPRRYTLDLLFLSDAALTAMEGLIATEQTLTFDEGSFRAVLRALERTALYLEGKQVWRATFTRVS